MGTPRLLRWDASLPLERYPERVHDAFRDDAGTLLKELRERYLHVVLLPAPFPRHSGHKIRAAENTNPPWYRDLWHEHAMSDHDRSPIKRTRVAGALGRIAAARDKAFRELPRGAALPWTHHYDMMMRQLIFERLSSGYEDEMYGPMPPHPLVRKYFHDRVVELCDLRAPAAREEESPIPW